MYGHFLVSEIIFAVLLVLLIWYAVVWWLEQRTVYSCLPSWFRFAVHPYIIFYVVMAHVLLQCLNSTKRDYVRKHDWFDTSTFEPWNLARPGEFVVEYRDGYWLQEVIAGLQLRHLAPGQEDFCVVVTDNSGEPVPEFFDEARRTVDASQFPLKFQQEIECFRNSTKDKFKLPEPLLWLSLGTPIAASLSFIIAVTHSLRIWRHWGGVSIISGAPRRSRVIQVVALPLIYGILSFRSVLRTWGLFTGGFSWTSEHGTAHWELHEKERLFEKIYESNYLTAALYEAWALFQFACLCTVMIKAWFAQRSGASHADGGEVAKSATTVGHELLVATLRWLTMQGVFGFVFVCALSALWVHAETFFDFLCGGSPSTLLARLPEQQWLPKQFQQWVPKQFPHLDLLWHGVGCLASSQALLNIVTVETTFHAQLEHFRPAPKFWSTKLLVSLAFIQSLALKVVRYMEWMKPPQCNLLYSSLVCYEIFFVSWLHVYAWPPAESWLEPRLGEEVAPLELLPGQNAVSVFGGSSGSSEALPVQSVKSSSRKSLLCGQLAKSGASEALPVQSVSNSARKSLSRGQQQSFEQPAVDPERGSTLSVMFVSNSSRMNPLRGQQQNLELPASLGSSEALLIESVSSSSRESLLRGLQHSIELPAVDPCRGSPEARTGMPSV